MSWPEEGDVMSLVLSTPEAIGEVRESIPIVWREVVDAGAHMVRATAADERPLERRHVRRRDRRVTPQRKDRRTRSQRQELAAGIGPEVLVGTRHVERPRRDERQQQMLIDRQRLRTAVERLVGA